MNLFFAPQIAENPLLPEQEARHALNVLRLGAGGEIDIADGKGRFYRAIILEPNPKRCKLEIISIEEQKPLWDNKIEIAVAPTKNIDRMEWFVEKAVEIGIDSVVFLACRYSERKEIKIERLQKVAIAAMKQSLKATLPEIGGMIDFKTFIHSEFDGQKFIAHCYPLDKELLTTAYWKNENVRILIGPEGDFSEEEIALANEAGYTAISLCNSRLRTETAALFACHSIHILNMVK
ncbi:MAG: 16S rRNA (uracil(1498)-N(3))-methyltransferase [Dysgonamonadaceae bacterium]|jgi:16S rRNA (uracil1498-N3)-methyltransferase|nr:16S rRNA (uracil(1498)-N(3))-methyltransferase [Dysgonamonadaceae bacterium]